MTFFIFFLHLALFILNFISFLVFLFIVKIIKFIVDLILVLIMPFIEHMHVIDNVHITLVSDLIWNIKFLFSFSHFRLLFVLFFLNHLFVCSKISLRNRSILHIIVQSFKIRVSQRFFRSQSFLGIQLQQPFKER